MLGDCIASQSEVIRAIVSEYSPCCGHGPCVRRGQTRYEALLQRLSWFQGSFMVLAIRRVVWGGSFWGWAGSGPRRTSQDSLGPVVLRALCGHRLLPGSSGGGQR